MKCSIKVNSATSINVYEWVHCLYLYPPEASDGYFGLFNIDIGNIYCFGTGLLLNSTSEI